ncbi:MAG TPA: exodeoxyribonuclease VII small subunit [Anaerolineae bacterium]|nr:exodeoxyribonuclease VII small subunit [Anaerolineae bacterium]
MDFTTELSYEQALAELEDIVAQLEGGTLALDETVALYQRGRNLAAHCQRLLDGVDLKVRQLVASLDGKNSVVDFSVEG